MTAVAAAFETLAGRLSHVSLTLLAVAVALHVANLLLRSTAWRSVLAAAMPAARVRWRSVTGAYLAGAGVNSVVPARSGDVVKIVLASRSIPGSRSASVASSLLVESMLDAVVGAGLIAWAVRSGALPLDRLTPAAIDGRMLALAAALMAALAVAAAIRTRGRLGRVLTGLRRGLAILGHPRAYALRVAAPQTLAWACRVAGMACFLGAFHISGGLGVAALALVAGSITTVVPLTPGGVGTQQAMLVVLLAPVASPACRRLVQPWQPAGDDHGQRRPGRHLHGRDAWHDAMAGADRAGRPRADARAGSDTGACAGARTARRLSGGATSSGERGDGRL